MADHSKGITGVIHLNKPTGMTSRQAVDCVKRLARGAKVGHAGTLDPLATGVLVVCVGAATRLINYVQRPSKRYIGTFLLGRTSPTEDTDGEVILLDNPPQPTRAQIDAVLVGFHGRIEQRPPAYSALKINGRRAYDLARRGHEVEFAARPVEIHAVSVVDYDYPSLTLDIVCGSGTYIRSLGRDLAEHLGTGAVMAALMRTAVGGFGIEDAVSPAELTAETYPLLLGPALRAVDWLPRIELSAEEIAQIRNGVFITRGETARWAEHSEAHQEPLSPPDESGSIRNTNEFAAIAPDGRLAAIVTPRGAGKLGATINLVD